MCATSTILELSAPPPCHPKELLPLETPPIRISLPSLPSPPRNSLLDSHYTLSTHLVPAAYPRMTPDVPLPSSPNWNGDKAVFKASVAQTAEHILALKERQWLGELDGLLRSRRPLWNCVNRYVRKDAESPRTSGPRRRSVTLFCAHGTGFPKEIWEPTLYHLVHDHDTSVNTNCSIDEIWSWEAVNHGDAALVNRDSLGGLYDARDNSRDILHFLLYYLPQVPRTAGPLPTHLPRLSQGRAASRREHGFGPGMDIVFIGHSFGGSTILPAAHACTKLFKTIILIEPIVYPPTGTTACSTFTRRLVEQALGRRDSWSSPQEAHRSFFTIPFFRKWNARALEVYVECALHEVEGAWKLKMSGVHEAICYAETYTPQEIFVQLPQLNESVELRWITAGGLPNSELAWKKKVIWRRLANSSDVQIACGHLVVQEAPADLGEYPSYHWEAGFH
ncbi:hypothetical protein BD413DRAFT_473512 [Trametes elegans]|nr:hypothetical protein BD413DRAFT_473512 [Trametes elegans]